MVVLLVAGLVIVGCSKKKETTTGPDTQAPTCSITYPANNATVSGTVNITADVTDNKGVTKVEFYKVEFYIDGNLVSTDTDAPYGYSWSTSGLSGSHTICAKAYDVANNVGTSAVINVTVIQPNSLTIESVPSGAKICLRGPSGSICSWTQLTPYTFTGLTAGSYCVTLAKDGYYEWHAIEYEQPVVVDGQATTLTANLVSKFATGTNVALQSQGAIASASGWSSYGGYDATPSQANDGIANVEQGRTFWADYPLPSWLKISLPSIKSIRTIVIHPYYHDLTFQIEGTTDTTNWFTLVNSTFLPHTGKAFTLSSATNVLEVRLTVTNSTAPASYLWKTPIYELELWQY
ncbi:MAG: Ig-like domain-containing protein [Candidatus Edwardsbacteria bacterium]